MPLDNYGLGLERSYREITFEEFHKVCNQYGPIQLTTDPYENLEDLRLHTIPQTIQQRRAAGCAFMEKVELQILGEYRRKQPPGLLIKPMARAIASNAIENVRENTRQAFLLYGEKRNYFDAINKLMELNGVSFALGTLMLHELDPVNVPYFTEGLYRWVREDEAREGTWDRKVDYVFKHYRILMDKVAQLRSRLRRESGVDVSALEVEQVARELTTYALEKKKRNRNEEEDDYLLKPIEKKEKKRLGPPKSATDRRIGGESPPASRRPCAARYSSPAQHVAVTAMSNDRVVDSAKPRKKRGRPPLARTMVLSPPPTSRTPAAPPSTTALSSGTAPPSMAMSRSVAASAPVAPLPPVAIPRNPATSMTTPDAHAPMRNALLAFQRTT